MKQNIKKVNMPRYHFFIAANGYSGFRSHYHTFFSSLSYSRVYIIQGGPGTGKSHLMKKLAGAVESRGGNAAYIHCSSDPESLDGIVLSKKGIRIAVLDGTAPHIKSPNYPGVIDEIVNLGAYWNADKLRKDREMICRFQEEKNEQYQMAYHYLALAGETDRLSQRLLASCIDHQKLQQTATRAVRHLATAKAYEEQITYWDACSMKGQIVFCPQDIHLETILVEDYLGSAYFYLNAVRDRLRENKQQAYLLIPSCLTDEKTNALLIQNGPLFTIQETEKVHKTVNMKRFFRTKETTALRPQIRKLRSLHEDLTEMAGQYLKKAGDYHFALEKMYGAAMDFSALGICTEALKESILTALF